MQLFTNGIGEARAPNNKTFPDDSGFRLKTTKNGVSTYELIDSDIVCFPGSGLFSISSKDSLRDR